MASDVRRVRSRQSALLSRHVFKLVTHPTCMLSSAICTCVHECVRIKHDFFCSMHMISNCEELLDDSLIKPCASKTSVKKTWALSRCFRSFFYFCIFWHTALLRLISTCQSRKCVNVQQRICLIKILCLCKMAVSPHHCHVQGESTANVPSFYNDISAQSHMILFHTHQQNKCCFNPVSKLLNGPITTLPPSILSEKLEFAQRDAKWR